MSNFSFRAFFVIFIFLLAQSEKISGEDVIVHLVASYFQGAPDGVQKQVIGINGSFPGPTIHAKLGDTLVIKVTNLLKSTQLGELNTSVHWHGIEMMYTPYDDGPEGVTQCPIPYGESMTYRYKLYQSGTYWYHSHHQWQYVEGFWGLLIVENVPGEVHEYDEELTPIALSDWHHKTAHDLSQIFHMDDTMNPKADSGLINGRGIYPCALAIDAGFVCDPAAEQSYEIFTVNPGKTYRIRLINTAARSGFNFSIDGHQMTVIETDGVDTVAVGPVDVVEIWPAQRYSVLVTMNGDLDSYWIRAEMNDESRDTRIEQPKAILHYDREFCPEEMSSSVLDVAAARSVSAEDPILQKGKKKPKVKGSQGRPEHHHVDWDLLTKEAKSSENGRKKVLAQLLAAGSSPNALNYEFPASIISEPIPANQDSKRNALNSMKMASVPLPTTMPKPLAQRQFLDPSKCRPEQSCGVKSAPNYYDKQIVLNVTFAPTIDPPVNHALINGFQYKSNNWPPVIVRILKEQQIDNSSVPQPTPQLDQIIEVVINNDMDFDVHPWHLHGHTFWVLGQGEPMDGPYVEWRDKEKLNVNGVMRDTTITHPYSWAVVRYRVNNPGAWLFHCHINWHLEVGLGAVFIEAEEELKTLRVIPEEAKRVCALSGITI